MSGEFFRGQEVLITGGSSGIGQAMAKRFSALGSSVNIIDVVQPFDIDEVSYFEADVSDKNSLPRIGQKQINLLAIAAGVTSETNDPSPEEKDLMDGVNVRGVKNTLDVYSPLLQPGSVLVYLGSDDPPKDYYAETKKKGARLVSRFSEENPKVKTLIAYLGPVRTSLFEKGKPAEVINRIEKNVGLYEPEEIVDSLLDELLSFLEAEDNFREVVMYKRVGD